MAEGDMKVDIDLQMKGLEEIEQALRKLKILLTGINTDLKGGSKEYKIILDAMSKMGSIQGITSKIGKRIESVMKKYNDTIEQSTKTKYLQDQLNERLNKTIKADLDLAERKHILDLQRSKDLMAEHAQYQKDQSDRVDAHILARSKNRLEIEDMKTSRERMKVFKKLMGNMSGAGGVGSLGGIFGMGIGAGVGAANIGGEAAGKKMKGFSGRILNYQDELQQSQKSRAASSKYTDTGIFSKMAETFPKLSKAIVGGGKGDGLMGKAAGGAGLLGGIAGMAAGGAAGIVGGMIMKGLESSPMFQSVSKIMNQAFSLYLRPIGDFVGGFFMPISRVMMKQAAIALKSNTKMIQWGEKFGMSVVALLSNPMGFVQSAFVTLIRFIDEWFHRTAIPWLNPNANKSYKSTFGGDDVKSLFTDSNSLEYKGKMYDDGFVGTTYVKILEDADAQLKKIQDLSKDGSEGFASMSLSATNIEDNLSKKSDKALDIFSQGMKDMNDTMKDKFDPKKDIERFRNDPKMRAYYENAPKAGDDYSSLFGGSTSKGGNSTFNKMYDVMEKQRNDPSLTKTSKQLQQEIFSAQNTKDMFRTDAQRQLLSDNGLNNKKEETTPILNNMDKALALLNVTAGDQLRAYTETFNRGEANDKLLINLTKTGNEKIVDVISKANQEILDRVHGITPKGGASSSSVGIAGMFQASNGKYYATEEQAIKNSYAGYFKNNKPQAYVSTTNPIGANLHTGSGNGERLPQYYADNTNQDTRDRGEIQFYQSEKIRLQAIYENASQNREEGGNARLRKIYRDNYSSAGIAMYDINQKLDKLIQAYNKTIDDRTSSSQSYLSNTPTYMAAGGIINETIHGIGASGKRYVLGERGSEMVTPMNKVGNNSVVNVTINIDKMTSDVDLQKIKPIIERALLETHARRGII